MQQTGARGSCKHVGTLCAPAPPPRPNAAPNRLPSGSPPRAPPAPGARVAPRPLRPRPAGLAARRREGPAHRPGCPQSPARRQRGCARRRTARGAPARVSPGRAGGRSAGARRGAAAHLSKHLLGGARAEVHAAGREAGAGAAARRKAALEALLAEAVVHAALLRVGQRLVRLADLLELFGRALAVVGVLVLRRRRAALGARRRCLSAAPRGRAVQLPASTPSSGCGAPGGGSSPSSCTLWAAAAHVSVAGSCVRIRAAPASGVQVPALARRRSPFLSSPSVAVLATPRMA